MHLFFSLKENIILTLINPSMKRDQNVKLISEGIPYQAETSLSGSAAVVLWAASAAGT